HPRCAGAGARELLGGLDAVDTGHPDVHQYDVRRLFPAEPDRLGPVRGGTHDGEVGLCVEQTGEPAAYHIMVVRDDEPDRAHDASAGRVASTRKPPTDAGPARNWPPTAAARSRMPSSPCAGAGAGA